MPLFHKKKEVVEDTRLEEEEGVYKKPSYLIPGILVTILFFLWGFSYGLLDTLNKHFRNVLGITATQSTYMQVAYFGAYFIFSMPASMISRRFGYKKAIVFGLLLYVIGALCFYPSAVNLSFGGFVGALFVIACGITTLENCANTYITIIGSRESASFRLNAAQAFNGLAGTIAPVIASYAFFGSNEDTGATNLNSVKWTYVGVACGVFCVAVFFVFANIPEVDEEALMAQEAEETGEVVRRASLYSPHVLLGAFAQFMYVGGQVSLASMFIFYSNEVGGYADNYGAILLSIGQGCFTVGRFLGAGLMKRFRPDLLMIVFSTCALIANVFVVAMKTPSTTFALLVIMFFESIMYPTIFALGTKDLGHNHKRGSAFLVMAVSGGCCLPPIMAVIHDKTNVNISFVIPLISWGVVLFYGLIGHRWIKYVDEPLVIDNTPFKHEGFEDGSIDRFSATAQEKK